MKTRDFRFWEVWITQEPTGYSTGEVNVRVVVLPEIEYFQFTKLIGGKYAINVANVRCNCLKCRRN